MKAFVKCGAPNGCNSSRALRSSVVSHAQLSFSVQQEVGFGNKLVIVGSPKPLGDWKVRRGAELKWNQDDWWTGSVEVPDGSDVEFKIVRVSDDGNADWEGGDNRKLRVDSGGVAVQVGRDRTMDVKGGSAAEQHKQPAHHDNGAQRESSSPPPSNGASPGESGLAHTKWQGKDISFMRNNQHSKERSGVWRTDSLEGAMLELVKGDEKAGSWLQKLEVAKRLIVDQSKDMRPGLDTLAPLYIYLSWISTGSIQCVEGGGHFRPNRHAELSKIMFRSIEWVSGDPSKTPLERLLGRKMAAKLPSFSEAFTASVPLTRIRDIAHRNDIPSDLKAEIKHTLQNKLHRNAGPEDLVATELMLEKVTRNPGEFNDAFVKEFKVFTEELRDFFSAGSLTFLLDAVMPALEDNERTSVKRFQEAKAKVDSTSTPDMNLVMDLMHNLTTVRAVLLSKLTSGLRNDAPDNALVMRQRVRLAEIRCEEYGYVTLSRVINLLDGMGGSDFLARAREEAWAQPIGAIVLAVRNCCLSGWQPAECFAIEKELEAWQQLGVAGDKEQMMRLKATLERAKRLTDEYAQVMLDTFATAALRMGGALGVNEEVQQVFTEAEIRANIAFQLSKLSSALLKAARGMLGSGDFDPLVTGTAVGELVAVDEIKSGQEHAGGRPCILLVERADGDEEVTSAGRNIRGVILCQDLPHLSHLGVRARQEKVVFVTCTTKDAIDSVVRPLLGKQIELIADGSQVAIKQASGSAAKASSNGASNGNGNGNGNGAAPAGPTASTVDKASREMVVPLADAVTATCGAKSAACARLAQASRNSTKGAEFSAAAGAALPFGCMEAAINSAGKSAEFNKLLEQVESCGVDGLHEVCSALQALVLQCPPSADTLAALRKELPGAGIVIARSSANVEDLAGMSGAGLYDSVPNLELASDDSVGHGIAQVWASLFTQRAVLSRRAAGVAQKDACMAVLVQEMLVPDNCFVLHTRNPLGDSEPDGGASALYAEVAPGMGETLASGTSGSAWRLVVDKASSKVSTLAFANFSQAYMPSTGRRAPAPGESIYASSDGGVAVAAAPGKVAVATVDYSKHTLSVSADARTELGQRLCRIGVALEDMFEGPQDVEGALVGNVVYVVQTRPQP